MEPSRYCSRLRPITSLVLAFALVVPTTALATQPDATTTAAPAQPAPQPQPDPAAQPQYDPAAQPQYDPAAQPQYDPAAQPQPAPAPVYQPPPQPIPPPVNPNRGLGLMIAGVSVFSISYIISAVSAAILIDTSNEDIGRPLLIPVAGPFVAISRTPTAIGSFGLGFAGLAQLAGFGMSIGGGVWFGRSRSQARLSAGPGGLQLQF